LDEGTDCQRPLDVEDATMRYVDASHVDLGSFYARNPSWGKIYRLLGYLALMLTVLWAEKPQRLSLLLVGLLLVWLCAWFQVVGALWRSSLVAAVLTCAMLLSMHALRFP
jgi:hypothetical protein